MRFLLIILLFSYPTFSFCQKIVLESTSEEKAPEVLNLQEIMSLIVYPEEAREEKIEGRCLIKVLVSTEGDVIETNKVDYCDTVFHDEVIKAVKLLKFSPAYIEGEPVKCWVTIPIKFSLRKKNIYNKEIYRY